MARCGNVCREAAGQIVQQLVGLPRAPQWASGTSGSSPQVLSVVSWCHPSLPLSSPPRFSPHSPRIVVSSAPLSSCHPSRLYPHCGPHGGILTSSPRRRARAACKGSSRRASPAHRVASSSSLLVATSPRLRLVIAASSHRPPLPLSSHPLPGSSEAGEGFGWPLCEGSRA